MIRNIEFVCSGNNGRSPVAECIGNRVLKTLKIVDVKVSSSGTNVNISGDLKQILRHIVDKAIAKGIFDEDKRERLEICPQAVLEDLVAYENRLRDTYLAESIGEVEYTHKPRQTIVRAEAQLILPVDTINLKRVQKLYRGLCYKPRIETLEQFSGLNVILEGDFPCTEQEYRKIAVQIEASTRVAILKAINYF